MAQLDFAILQEFFRHCETGDVCSEEEVIVTGRSHFHCLLCQALVHSASKLKSHCVRHANAKHLPHENEMCVKHFTRFMSTCSQNCLLSQSGTKHMHCKLCGGAHTDPDNKSLGQHVERWHIRHYTEVKEVVDLARKLRKYICPEASDQDQEMQQQDHHEQEQQQAVEAVQVQSAEEMGCGADASTTVPQSVYTQGEVPPGSWQTSTTQMTDGSLATVHHWTGATPPVYPPSCTLQSMEQSQQGTESYILQEHPVSQTGSEFVIQEAAVQSGVDEAYTLQVETTALNPSQEAASIILQMMDRAQMPSESTAQANQSADDTQAVSEINSSKKRPHTDDNISDTSIKLSKQSGTGDQPSDSDAPALVLRSRPLPGTVIDPVVVPPKVCHQCLVCGATSYLRTLRVCSEGNRRHMNKAQTARLMTFYKLALDPTLPGKLICKKDYEAWLTYDKQLQQLLAGDETKSPKDSPLMIKPGSANRKQPAGVTKKCKSDAGSVNIYAKSGSGKSEKPLRTGMQIRVPRSKRLKERMEKQAAAMSESNDENKQDISDQDDENTERLIEGKRTQSAQEQIVIVSVGDEVEEPIGQNKSGEMQYKVIVTVPETSKEGVESGDKSENVTTVATR